MKKILVLLLCGLMIGGCSTEKSVINEITQVKSKYTPPEVATILNELGYDLESKESFLFADAENPLITLVNTDDQIGGLISDGDFVYSSTANGHFIGVSVGETSCTYDFNKKTYFIESGVKCQQLGKDEIDIAMQTYDSWLNLNGMNFNDMREFLLTGGNIN